MPSPLDAPVLQVDANVIHKVDTSNPQNLFSMWTVFARCADNVAQGRRLENLSWRLWTRETFCVENASSRVPSDRADSFGSASDNASVASSLKPKAIPPKRSQPSTDEVPQLSGSVESIADEEAVELASGSSSADLSRPRIRRQDSCGSNRSRGRERHITSNDLEKMVVSIVKETQCLTAPFPEITPFCYPAAEPQQTPAPEAAPTPESAEAEEAAAEAAAPIVESQPETAPGTAPVAAPEAFPTMPAVEFSSYASTQHGDGNAPGEPVLQKSKSTTEVIRGFSPSHMPIVIPHISTTSASDEHVNAEDDAIPEPTSAPQAKQVQSKKASFALGGSSSCEDSLSDPSRSLDMRASSMSQHLMKGKAAASPEEEGSLKSAFHLSRHSLAQKKQTSFSNHVTTRTIPAAAAAADDASDSDDIDESAIDDDDDDESDWEDSNEESGRSSMDDKNMFQRVDSTQHLRPNRSLITLMIQRSEHDVKNGLTTSQSTLGLPRTRGQHQPPSLAASPNDSDGPALMMRSRSRGPQSSLRPINEIPRSAAQPIMTSTVGVARSPRTNRRMMLSTELTESLRRHLLWERSQKTSTANAVLKRRHTSHDVANLKQYPVPVHMNKDNDSEANAGSWDHYLNRDAFDGYHAKGW